MAPLNESGPTLLGMVHLLPLPGSPGSGAGGLEPVIERARTDVERLRSAGFDGVMIENFGDVPFHGSVAPAHTLTAMTRVALALETDGLLVGINVLRNDAAGALSVAMAVGADLIRVNVHVGAAVTDQGVIEGRAAETVRLRQRLAPHVAIMADVDVKHARPLGLRPELADLAKETAYRGLADALIVTGSGTGNQTSYEDLQVVRAAVPDRPLFVGSGVDVDSVSDLLALADGVIVGTSIKEGRISDAPVDEQRARALVARVRRREDTR
ncbi:MAG: BtpA/SgcQ family protein [Myxococcota bacterium]|nr:BtpA/SgcQ family protein [Myxococcota bacterium]